MQYKNESFEGEENFLKTLKAKNKFKFEKTNSFKIKTERYGVYTPNPKVKLNTSKEILILTCNIKSSMYNPYSFHQFLVDSLSSLCQFGQYEREFACKGKIENVSTVFMPIFPYLITHCYQHVWLK